MIRPLAELIDAAAPGLAVVREWMAQANNQVEELPGTRAAGERALHALQITSRSPMGALALETGGLLIDHGWLRVLGGGSERIPRALDTWNGILPGEQARRLEYAVLMADDAVGGFFALNGGGLDGPVKHVFYYAPDSLQWEEVAESYSDWLFWAMTGDLAKFYETLRWPGWQAEVAALRGDQAIHVYPPLFTAGEDLAHRSRRPVPLEELWRLCVEDLPAQLAGKAHS